MKSNYKARLKTQPSAEVKEMLRTLFAEEEAKEMLRTLFAEEIEAAKKEAADKATARAIMISCVALHTRAKDPYGEKRLADHLGDVQRVCDRFVNRYDDSAMFGMLRTLETDCPGIDWRKLFGIDIVEEVRV